jgi:hypothetical protein
MISFCRKFILAVSILSSPLTDMLRKGVKEPLQWSNTATSNFETLKNSLSSCPILKLPDVAKPFVLRTDASGIGIGAVLLQYHNSFPHPVAYASCKLYDREKRYSAIERVCLAMVWGISKFKCYLMGYEFILEIDHQPLIYMNKFKETTRG